MTATDHVEKCNKEDGAEASSDLVVSPEFSQKRPPEGIDADGRRFGEERSTPG